MLWFTIWFLVILKIPALYLAWVIWWAVKDPPEAWSGAGGDVLDGGEGPEGPPRRWRPRSRRPVRGPHGSPVRRPARAALTRARAEG